MNKQEKAIDSLKKYGRYYVLSSNRALCVGLVIKVCSYIQVLNAVFLKHEPDAILRAQASKLKRVLSIRIITLAKHITKAALGFHISNRLLVSNSFGSNSLRQI